MQDTGNGATLKQCLSGFPAEPVPADASSNYGVMDYYDGNTVTALWNYAQHFSMSDNAYTTGFGPSTPVRSMSSRRRPTGPCAVRRPPPSTTSPAPHRRA